MIVCSAFSSSKNICFQHRTSLINFFPVYFFRILSVLTCQACMSSTTCQRIFAQSIIDPCNCNRIHMTSTCHNTSLQSHCIARLQPVSTPQRLLAYLSSLAYKLSTNSASTPVSHLATTSDRTMYCCFVYSCRVLFVIYFLIFCALLYFISLHFRFICQSYACARRQLSLLSARESTTVRQVNRCHFHCIVLRSQSVVESSIHTRTATICIASKQSSSLSMRNSAVPSIVLPLYSFQRLIVHTYFS